MAWTGIKHTALHNTSHMSNADCFTKEPLLASKICIIVCSFVFPETLTFSTSSWFLHLLSSPYCQGTSLAVCTPLYTLFTVHISPSFYFAYIHLLLFGYQLNLSCSQ